MTKQPLYQKIYQDLKLKIMNQTYQEGDQLPTELELADMYQVSRITSKRALVELENDGFIYRLRGKGSFVSTQEEKPVFLEDKTDVLFMLPFAEDPGFGNYAQGIMNYLEQTNYRLHIQPHQSFSLEERQKLLAEYAGLIYYPRGTQESLDFLYQCYLEKMPVVLLDKTVENIPFPSVLADNELGGFLATEHLLGEQCEEVWFISTEPLAEISSVRDRYFGYLKALHQQGKEGRHFAKESGENLPNFFDDIIKEIGGKKEKIGLVVENDVIAIRLMTALKKLEIQIPEQVALVGFDNIQAASLVDPKLTTLSQDFYQMGKTAAKLLMEHLHQPVSSQRPKVIPVDLIIRGSSKERDKGVD
ncbi:GntR family transcriptional regulator [Vagococcus humatus]|uniref:AraC family transcriptional regulator n=1 Tax=Vagococcus humatus TaxID=1889241 RepID=A0A429Z579_9ENTE|nr:GntR family transcriptional regulator [Vagococcus humatus]RST88861.1 AraC family transcriptional regulator [Vagococcus humatus]